MRIRKPTNFVPQAKLEKVYRNPLDCHLRYGNELLVSLSDRKQITYSICKTGLVH